MNFPHENSHAARVPFREALSISGYPLPTLSLKPLLGAGSAKLACKILISNNLEVKILKTIELKDRQ